MRHLLFRTSVLLALSTSASAADGWRQGWGLAGPPPAPVPQPQPQHPGLAQLRLEGVGDRWQARVDNPLHGPLQIELRAAGGRVLPGLPLAAVLPARGRVVAGGLPSPQPQQALDLRLRAVPGDPAARPRDVSYALPFAGAAVRVSQGPTGQLSHTDAGNRDAIDFAMAEGTPVLAARAGRVMQLRDGFGPGTQQPGQDLEQVNFVRVLHDDGSMAVYAHLLAGALQVRAGQQVQTGQVLGRSGSSGYSSGPHLHFVVQVNRGLQLHSIPARIVTAQGELRLAREPAGTPAATAPAAAGPH